MLSLRAGFGHLAETVTGHVLVSLDANWHLVSCIRIQRPGMPLACSYRINDARDAMSDLSAESDDSPAAGSEGQTGSGHRPARTWLGRLATYIASFAGGMAANDLSGTLGYPGLAGAISFLGVVTAALWIRKLDPCAPLARYAPRLFLVPAGCAAVIAAFMSGSAVSILTFFAALLTVGAVLLARELESAGRQLAGAGIIAFGAAGTSFGTARIVGHNVQGGAGVLALGIALVVAGAAIIAGRAVLGGSVLITIGALVILAGTTVIGSDEGLTGAAGMALGAAVAIFGIAFMTRRSRLAGAGIIAFGMALILFGTVHINSQDMLGIALITGGAAGIVGGAALMATRDKLAGMAFAAFGAALIVFGTADIVNHDPIGGASLVAGGTAGITFGTALIGHRDIMVRARELSEWATKPPSETNPRHPQRPPGLPSQARVHQGPADRRTRRPSRQPLGRALYFDAGQRFERLRDAFRAENILKHYPVLSHLPSRRRR